MPEMGEAVAKGDEDEDKDDIYFIAIADRAVKGTIGLFYHYSIQYWKSTEDVALQSEMGADELSGATKLSGTELIRKGGWKVWEYEYEYEEGLLLSGTWHEAKCSVSVIYMYDSSNKLAAVYKGSKDEADVKWKTLINNASNYTFAEQGGDGFSGNFQNWPNSRYQMPWDKPFNNSNTFVRTMTVTSGLSMFELSGSHPGNVKPVQLPNKYSDKPWREGQSSPPRPIHKP